MLKRGTIVILALCLMASLAYGVVPGKMSYEGRLLDAAGLPVTAGKTLTFSIYDAAREGNKLWTSASYAVTPDSAGVFSVNLGSNADAIDPRIFNGDERYLEITVNGEKLDPRTQLTSVAYAYKAVDAETVGGVPAADLLKVDGDGSNLKNIKVADSAITTVKIADASVNTAKIADGAVTDAKITSISASKIVGSIPGTQVLGTTAPGPHAAAHYAGGADSLADYYVQKSGDNLTGTITSSATTALQSPRTLTLKSNNNGEYSTTEGVVLDANALKLLSVRYNGVEKAYVNATGQVLVYGNFYPASMPGQANAGGYAYYGLNTNKNMFGMYNTYTGPDAGPVGVVGSGTSNNVNNPAILLDTLSTIPARSGLKIVSIKNNGSDRVTVDGDGNLAVSGGVRFGNMTTEQRDAIVNPPAGYMIFNSTTHKMNFYTGSTWETIISE